MNEIEKQCQTTKWKNAKKKERGSNGNNKDKRHLHEIKNLPQCYLLVIRYLFNLLMNVIAGANSLALDRWIGPRTPHADVH